MKKQLLPLLLTMFMSMVGIEALAYDFAVDNADGVTIYYTYVNDGKELEVTFGNTNNSYSGSVIIPEEVSFMNRIRKVTSIGEKAFQYCTNLTSVTLPNGVTSIGWRAFMDCRSLTSVTIPNNVEFLYVSAFEGCSGLTSVTIPNSVKNICDRAFFGCSGLTSVTIPGSVKSIGIEVFAGCNLQEVISEIKNPFLIYHDTFSDNTFYNATLYVPRGTIDKYKATSGWKKFIFIEELDQTGGDIGEIFELNGITYKILDDSTVFVTSREDKYSGEVVIPEKVDYLGATYSVSYIGNFAFYNCSGLTSITIPQGVITIGDSAFSGCSGLTSIMIPNSVKIIADMAFSWCISLTSITIPDSVTVIGDAVFQYCSGLTSVTISNSVTHIGYGAFNSCINLTSVTIPSSVTHIGSYAFSFSGLTSLTIPDSVTDIEDNAFAGCSGLTSLKVESGNINYDSRNNCNAIIETSSNTIIRGCINTTIPNDVTSIGSRAFDFCTDLNSIVIPNSVTSICEQAFLNCNDLFSVKIPNSITSICEYAFKRCSSLTEVISEIENPFKIDDSVFDGIPSNARLTVPKGTVDKYKATEGWKEFKNIREIGQVGGEVGEIFESDGITYQIDYDNIIFVISGREEYTGDVVIPNQVTYLGATYPVTGIGYYAFSGCNNLNSITIPKSITYVGENAFWGCDNLTAVYISDLEAFMNIFYPFGDEPGNPLYYSHHLFLNGEEIIDLIIPQGVTSITSDFAFINCSSLRSVSFPNSIVSIGVATFMGCSSLEEIHCKCTTPPENRHAFDNDIYSNATLYVPKGTVDAYKAAELWKNFQNIVEEISDEITNVNANSLFIQNNGSTLAISGASKGAEINVYNLAGQKVGSAKAGSKATNIDTSLRRGDIGIVKIGDKAMKVIMK